VEDAPLPKVSPSLLRSADELCARRLHAEYTGVFGSDDPVNRGRVRQAVLDALGIWHTTGAVSPPPSFLEPEEQRVVEHAMGWYPQLFPDRVGTTLENPIDGPTPLPRRGVRLGGWVDLCVVGPDGRRELRQLNFGAPRAPASPLELPQVRLAVLRLAQVRWLEPPTLDVAWVDLLNGAKSTCTLDIPGDLGMLGAWLDERLEVVRTRIATPTPNPGRDCTTCRFVPKCPAHDVKGSMKTKKSDLVPGMLTLSPTALDTWRRCRREWRNRVLLSLPASDPEGGTAHGLYLHDILRFVHQHGSCRDEDRVAEVLAMHGADERVAEEVRRHVTKCPVDAESVGHEVEWVRANPKPPTFLASARLDAVWRRGDVLEIRDYKTGQRGVESLADDARARLQAWVAAPAAAAAGLRLRLRYEYLSREVDEDPEPWEPDHEDLELIDAELHAVVADMRAEREWRGVADETVCRYCRYRSICPDSATPSEPGWPAVNGVDELAAAAEL